jgi:glyoxylase-like metal-dependent hydrolase (beta-lactamase superfamily II)
VPDAPGPQGRNEVRSETRPIRIGELSIDRIIEQEAPLFDPLTFFPTLSLELLAANRDWLEPRALDAASGRLVMCIQSYLIRTPQRTILVDSCVGNDKPRAATHPFWDRLSGDTYMRGLAALGLSVDDIDIVMCTHLHVDHVGWNTRLADGRWVPTFPNARYLFSRRELDYWTARNATAPVAWIVDSVLPIVAESRADLIANDHVLDEWVRLESTPGHTPDHLAVRIGRTSAEVLLTGDLIHSPLQARYPELSMRADYDPEQAAATRRRVLETYCDAGTILCTGHFPSPSAGRIARWGSGFRFNEMPA